MTGVTTATFVLGASIAFADLTVPSPAFGVVTQELETLNFLVAAMIRQAMSLFAWSGK